MSNEEIMKNYFKFRNEVLNKVSATFCNAKWLQSSIYLWNGYTHSCHHPVQHKVQVDDVLKNPKALHNSPQKICARKEMLDGKQTNECEYCWNIENLSNEHLSDRTYKSFDSWARPYTDEVIKSGLGEEINPTYLEVGFENSCNLKCAYCTPDVSTRWMEEIQVKGPYQLSNSELHSLSYLKKVGKYPIHKDEENPYVDAFWKWWPELYQNLKVFRITGGEPLLSAHVWRVLDYIAANPRSDIELAINTNLCVNRTQVDRLIKFANSTYGKIKSFEIYTSCEAVGVQAEYVRYGMNYQEFMENVHHILSNTPDEVKINFMTTINILSVSTFKNFLQEIQNLRKQYSSNKEHHNFNLNRNSLMLSYLRWPHFLSIKNLSQDLKDYYAKEWLDFVSNNMFNENREGLGWFYLEELDQVNRLIKFMLSDDVQNLRNRQDFYLFHKEYDARRNLDFKSTFPELIPYYQAGKKDFIRSRRRDYFQKTVKKILNRIPFINFYKK